MRSSEVAAILSRLCVRPIAHRGLHGCGRAAPVENTIGAAEAAIAAGFGIECDVRLSADGEAVVFHDGPLDRLTDASGPLAGRHASDLSSIRLRGSEDRIPTLESFLSAVGGRVPVVIEIKTSGGDERRLVDRVLDVIGVRREPIAVESFDPAVMRRCLDVDAPCPVGLVGPPERGEALDDALLGQCDFLSWNVECLASLTRRPITVPLTTWTVRTPAQQAIARSHGAQIVFEGFHPIA